ncbi:MAG: transcription elongation factor GreB [Myxococcota bacterium]|nr:transcription elongation factor GreB [Myxococcota bacterium]
MSEKHYISEAGFQKLSDEVAHLMTVERPRIVRNVADAAAEGDRSENAEYIYGKKRLREIDRRVEYLTKRLDSFEVVPRPTRTDRVRLLVWVIVEDDEGDSRAFRVVGADETNADHGEISWKSPVGRALLGKAVDDEVVVRTPGGQLTYTIVDICLDAPMLEDA